MSKAFTRADAAASDEDDGQEGVAPLPVGSKNYMTVSGYETLKAEFIHLMDVERPATVSIVSWAASNGDRSENGDYLYGKKRLREIDRRIRFLTKRLDIAEVVDPAAQQSRDQVFFGATVTYINGAGEEVTVTIVGVDEVDPLKGRISWISPVARALLKAREGDVVRLMTPAGPDELEIIEISYPMVSGAG
jgi:transcription elongation factor GreB